MVEILINQFQIFEGKPEQTDEMITGLLYGLLTDTEKGPIV